MIKYIIFQVTFVFIGLTLAGFGVYGMFSGVYEGGWILLFGGAGLVVVSLIALLGEKIANFIDYVNLYRR